MMTYSKSGKRFKYTINQRNWKMIDTTMSQMYTFIILNSKTDKNVMKKATKTQVNKCCFCRYSNRK